MSGVFRNIDPHPLTAQRVCPPPAPLRKAVEQGEAKKTTTLVAMSTFVEGLYCKRPIQCLASSEILTPHPLTAQGECTPPPAFGAGGGHTPWVERGWGVNS